METIFVLFVFPFKLSLVIVSWDLCARFYKGCHMLQEAP